MKTIILQGELESDVNRIVSLAKKLNLKVQIISSLEDEYKSEPGSDKLNLWNNLTKEQQNGVVKAMEQIEHGLGIPNHLVMAKHRKRYG
ncbi:MAG: hypothetical protein K0B37_17355 [Bacteroidales bacterium]|jgi:hypothetical protein|nr:hypothetical protein [Bacteroidales bacterium]